MSAVEDIDQEYVTAILAQAGIKMTREAFRAYTQPDRNGGWRAEADEAERRYFTNQ